MLNWAFDDFTPVKTDYYPEELQDEIDSINARIYETLNNGVYRCGFATTQKAYKKAFTELLLVSMIWNQGWANSVTCWETESLKQTGACFPH